MGLPWRTSIAGWIENLIAAVPRPIRRGEDWSDIRELLGKIRDLFGRGG